MNIAFVLPYMEPGGVETVVLRLGKYFVERGKVVSVIATDRKGDGWGSVQENGLRGACLACTDSFSQVAHAVKVGKYLANGFFDVVFLNHAPYAQAALRMLPDNVIAIPILHGDYEGAYRVGLRNAGAWNVAIGVSPRVCDVARGLMGSKPIVEICNGVDVPANEMWSRRTALKDHVRLLFVGHLQHSPKGVLFLPEILKGCLSKGIDASLTIVGGGPDLEKLVESVNESGLEGRSNFEGRCPLIQFTR